jgi:hypothetical protein
MAMGVVVGSEFAHATNHTHQEPLQAAHLIRYYALAHHKSVNETIQQLTRVLTLICNTWVAKVGKMASRECRTS